MTDALHLVLVHVAVAAADQLLLCLNAFNHKLPLTCGS